MSTCEVNRIIPFIPRSRLSEQGSVRVLYLDDDDIDRTLMQMHIKRHLNGRVTLHCVTTPCEAREALASQDFDYFVTDNRMPPISSYRETLDIVDVSCFTGRIIVVSSETRFDGFDNGTDERVHCITDKADLSLAIKDGLFRAFHRAKDCEEREA